MSGTGYRKLRDLIEADKAKPSFLISHKLPLADAPDPYKHFDDRDEGWTKLAASHTQTPTESSSPCPKKPTSPPRKASRRTSTQAR